MPTATSALSTIVCTTANCAAQGSGMPASRNNLPKFAIEPALSVPAPTKLVTTSALSSQAVSGRHEPTLMS